MKDNLLGKFNVNAVSRSIDAEELRAAYARISQLEANDMIKDARTIAIIARDRAVSQEEATALIEQYGRTVAAAAVVKATSEVCDQILEKLGHELGKLEHA